MPTSTSRLSYSDCFDYFEQAMADPKGLALAFDFSGDARQFRLRMHAARALDRKENAEMYEVGHPLFGRSMFDEFILKLRERGGTTYVIIEKSTAMVRQVIGLSELLPEDDLLNLPASEPEQWVKPKEVFVLTDRRF